MASILNAYLCIVLHLSTYLSIIYFVYLRQSCVAHACLLLTVQPKMTLNSWHSYFLLPSARITDMSYYAWLYLDFLRQVSRCFTWSETLYPTEDSLEFLCSSSCLYPPGAEIICVPPCPVELVYSNSVDEYMFCVHLCVDVCVCMHVDFSSVVLYLFF